MSQSSWKLYTLIPEVSTISHFNPLLSADCHCLSSVQFPVLTCVHFKNRVESFICPFQKSTFSFPYRWKRQSFSISRIGLYITSIIYSWVPWCGSSGILRWQQICIQKHAFNVISYILPHIRALLYIKNQDFLSPLSWFRPTEVTSNGKGILPTIYCVRYNLPPLDISISDMSSTFFVTNISWPGTISSNLILLDSSRIIEQRYLSSLLLIIMSVSDHLGLHRTICMSPS